MAPKSFVITSKPSSHIRVFLFLLIFLVCLALLVGGAYYWLSTKSIQVGEIVATGNIDVFLSPGKDKVGYFLPGQTSFLTGEKEDGFLQVSDKDKKEFLWIPKGSSYKLLPE